MRFLVLSVLAAASTASHAGAIRSCVIGGRLVIGDETTAAICATVTSKLHRGDGAPKGTIEPALSPSERDAAEAAALAAQRRLEAERSRQLAEQSLVSKYPDAAALASARDADTEPLRLANQRSSARLAELEKERKPLDDEAEFYPGKPLPATLRRAIDDNDALVAGQKAAMQAQQTELARIDADYRVRLKVLMPLWASRDAEMKSRSVARR